MAHSKTDDRENDRLGDYLKSVRQAKRLTLRQVEELSEREVSNAYLSQLENGKIAKPSPNILYKLAEIYRISYESIMSRAGYITSQAPREDGVKHGKIATFAGESLTSEEEEELLKYLAFLRLRRGG